MGRRQHLEGLLWERLETPRAAIEDVVTLGLETVVRGALEEATGNRPAMVRVTPAFRRV